MSSGPSCRTNVHALPVRRSFSFPVEQPPVADAVNQVRFLLQQRMGFRTVTARPTGAVPTIRDLELVNELASRTGASTIAAVGSGAAVDLAKAAHKEELVLLPATYGASIAAASSHSLIFDPLQESLMIEPGPEAPPQSFSTTTVVLEERFLDQALKQEASLAAIGILLDHSYRESLSEFDWKDAVQNLTHQRAAELMQRAGEALSYGFGSSERSLPLAVAASLAPTLFPEHRITSVMASLVKTFRWKERRSC